MRKITCVLIAVAVVIMTSCQKEPITPSKPELNTNPIDCKRCSGNWDLTDTIPANP